MTVIKIFLLPLTLKTGSNVKNLNFAITKSVVNILTEISYADRSTIDMKHIKHCLGMVPLVDLEGVAEAKIQLFLKYGHFAYQRKRNDSCSNMVATILPIDPSPDPGVCGQNSIFRSCSYCI